MKYLHCLLITMSITLCGCSQNTSKPNVNNQPGTGDIKAGGRCEDCAAIYQCPVPFEQLNEVDSLPDFMEPGPKIEISGTIFQRDGKTPAADIVLYVYHTDQKGLYSKKGNEKGPHGYIRGWVKTNAAGYYKFYTLVPASYPNSMNPKHIHPTIKESGISEYWIDEFLFDDDPLLQPEELTKTTPRGGSGILKTIQADGILKATRDITLGLHVTGYPVQ
ncbi:MAG: intradiol ring-cleavage dioxygenase [Bacteroidota bacterium]|nr:intradiol ring-cleavage dioxygenase [Bacteroidota bacterium]